MKKLITIAVLPAMLVGTPSQQLVNAATPAATAELPAATDVVLKPGSVTSQDRAHTG